MTTAPSGVGEFFEQYVRSRTVLDIDGIASQYPDVFMTAGPKGTRVTQRAAIVDAFPKGQSLLRAAGHTSTVVASLEETKLDSRYVLARVRFRWRFEKAAQQPIDVDVDSTFILFIDQGSLRIVFQHEREDFVELLRARGVLPR
jgi:hypothetical protein